MKIEALQDIEQRLVEIAEMRRYCDRTHDEIVGEMWGIIQELLLKVDPDMQVRFSAWKIQEAMNALEAAAKRMQLIGDRISNQPKHSE